MGQNVPMKRSDDDATMADSTLPTLASGLGSRAQAWAEGDLGARLTPTKHDELEERFKLGTTLGAGGMGEVLKCRDLRVGREVALKRLRPGQSTPELLRRFMREARVQGRLNHPAVVPVHELGVDREGAPYFIMKRVHGRTLSEILARQAKKDPKMLAKFPRRALLSALSRACLALEYAHARGVVHRDLKPANLMLGDFGELYLLDWGIALVEGNEDEATPTTSDVFDREDPASLADVVTNETQDGDVLGTLGYASPEQCRGGSKHVGPASDIYAMGILLYEALTRSRLMGKMPAYERLERTLAGIRAVPSELDPSVAPELDAIVAKATHLDPRERYGSMRELHDAIEGYLAGERNEELRRQLADEHAARAERTIAQSPNGEGRIEALREIGRALALGRDRTLELFFRIVDSPPPPEALDEVEARLDANNLTRMREAMRVGVLNYLLWLVMLPLMLWLGIRSVEPMLGALVCILGAAASCAVFARAERIGRGATYVVLLFNLGAIAFASRVLGPFVIVPQVVLATNFSFALTRATVDRFVFAALGLATVFVPLGLELAGVLAPSYVFDAEGIHVVPSALYLPALPTFVMMTFITVANLVSSTLFCGVVRKEIDASEGRSILQAWHLERVFGMPPRDSTPEV